MMVQRNTEPLIEHCLCVTERCRWRFIAVILVCIAGNKNKQALLLMHTCTAVNCMVRVPCTWQLHAALSVYPKFWDHWAFIYSRYCSYSSLIHNDVLPTTWHVSQERKLFDVGEIFFFYKQRRIKTLGTKIMSAWLIYLYWRREVFVNYHRTTTHIGQYFMLSAKFWL